MEDDLDWGDGYKWNEEHNQYFRTKTRERYVDREELASNDTVSLAQIEVLQRGGTNLLELSPSQREAVRRLLILQARRLCQTHVLGALALVSGNQSDQSTERPIQLPVAKIGAPRTIVEAKRCDTILQVRVGQSPSEQELIRKDASSPPGLVRST